MNSAERMIYVASNAGHGDDFVSTIQANYVYAGVTIVFGLVILALAYEMLDDILEFIYQWMQKKKSNK